MMNKCKRLIKQGSKKVIALLLVLMMSFSTNVYDAVKIVYASSVENLKEDEKEIVNENEFKFEEVSEIEKSDIKSGSKIEENIIDDDIEDGIEELKVELAKINGASMSNDVMYGMEIATWYQEFVCTVKWNKDGPWAELPNYNDKFVARKNYQWSFPSDLQLFGNANLGKPLKVGYTFNCWDVVLKINIYNGPSPTILNFQSDRDGKLQLNHYVRNVMCPEVVDMVATPNFTKNTIVRIDLNKGFGQYGDDAFWVRGGIFSKYSEKTVQIDKIEPPIDINKKYNFTGYWTQSSGTGGGAGIKKIEYDGKIIKKAADFQENATLYAGWKKNVYEITLDDNNGSGGEGTIYEWYNEGFYGASDPECIGTPKTSVAKPTRNSYTFLGYFDDSVTPPKQYIDETGTFTSYLTKTAFNTNKVLKAHWSKSSSVYKITFNTNGGSDVSPECVYITNNNQIYTDKACTVSWDQNIKIKKRLGYTFKGFVANADGTGNEYIRGIVSLDEEEYIKGRKTDAFTKENFTDSTNIYAKWEKNVYIVEIDQDEGSGGTNVLYVKYGEGIYEDDECLAPIGSTIDVPTKTGSKFAGYYDSVYDEKTGKSILTDKLINEDGTLTPAFTTTRWSGNPEIETIIVIAKWEKVNKIILDNNGGDGVTSTIIYVTDGSENKQAGAYIDEACTTPISMLTTLPTKLDKYFDGFVKNSNGTGIEYINGLGHITKNLVVSTTTDNQIIYAKWGNTLITEMTYDIILDNDGADEGYGGTQVLHEKYGTGIYDNIGCIPGTEVTNIIKPEKTGYMFKGYYDATFTTQYITETGAINTTNFTNTTFTMDKTLKAKWETNIYTIDLVSDGATTAGTTKLYVKYNDGIYNDIDCTIAVTSIIKPTKDNYTFGGYYNQGFTTQYIDIDGNFTDNFTATVWTGEPSVNIEMKAKWIPNVYKITLNNVITSSGTLGTQELWGKYGVGIFGNETCTGTRVATVNIPTDPGYKFKGYYDGVSTTEYIKETGAINTINFTDTAFTKDTILEAKWETNIYTINLDDNGATTAGVTNLYVKYNDGIYETFDCTGEKRRVLTTKPAKEHFVFGGYYDAGFTTEYINKIGNFTDNFTNITWSSDDTTTPIVMKAKWIPVHSITLDNNNIDAGSTEANPSTIYLEEGVGIFKDEACTTPCFELDTRPKRNSYGFQGFTENADGTGNTYIDDLGRLDISIIDAISIWTENKTLYAKWGPEVYRIELDNSRADIARGTYEIYEKYNDGIYAEFDCNTKVTNIETPVKIASEFMGYYDEDTMTIRYIDEGGAITSNFTNTTFTEATKLKAKWNANIYTINLNDDGATTHGTANLYVKYDEGIYENAACTGDKVYVMPILPLKDSYIFDGYWDNNYTVQYIDIYGNFTHNFRSNSWSGDPSIPIKMKAKWARVVNRITLDNNGADTHGTEAIYEKYNEGIYEEEECINEVNTIVVPKKAHYIFDGYYDIETLSKQYIKADGRINTDNFTDTTFYMDVTIIAKWIPIYKITLDNNGANTAGTNVLYEKYKVGIYAEEECITGITSITVPTKENYIFDGYYDTETLSKQYIKADGTINTTNFTSATFTNNTTLIAKWVRDVYKITLNQVGGMGGISILYKVHNGSIYTDIECQNIAKKISTPIRKNYTFGGYYTEKNGKGILCIDSRGNVKTNVFENSDITIYARWIAKGNNNTGGGGGGGGGGKHYTKTIPLPKDPVKEKAIDTLDKNESTFTFDKDSVNWLYDPIGGTWGLEVTVGEVVIPYKNAYAKIENTTYYFDKDGKMITGWVKDANGDYYAFEWENTANKGMMIALWRLINDKWYYFNENGKLLTNTITPDGYKVNAEGERE